MRLITLPGDVLFHGVCKKGHSAENGVPVSFGRPVCIVPNRRQFKSIRVVFCGAAVELLVEQLTITRTAVV